MNKFSNIAGRKVNAQNSVAFLYIKGENSEKEIQKNFLIRNSIENDTKLRNCLN